MRRILFVLKKFIFYELCNVRSRRDKQVAYFLAPPKMQLAAKINAGEI